MGIEPTSEAWEASILPLYDARSRCDCSLYMTKRLAHAGHIFETKAHRLQILTKFALDADQLLRSASALRLVLFFPTIIFGP